MGHGTGGRGAPSAARPREPESVDLPQEPPVYGLGGEPIGAQGETETARGRNWREGMRAQNKDAAPGWGGIVAVRRALFAENHAE